MSSRDDALDVAFIDVAVRSKALAPSLAVRVLEFARLKRKPVATVVSDLGVLSKARIEKTSRLARYRIARSEDRLFAEAAVRARVLTRGEAAATLERQRQLYRDGKGFLRFLALLRADGKLSHEDDRRIRDKALAVAEDTPASRPPAHSATIHDDSPTRAASRSAPPAAASSRSATKKSASVRPANPRGSGSTYGRVIAALA